MASISVAASNYQSGRPLSRTYQVTRTQVPNLTQVNQLVTVAPSGTVRMPSWKLLDLRVSKVLKIRGRVRVEPILDIYNVFNNTASLAEVVSVGPTLGRVSNNIYARLVRLGLQIGF